MLFEANGLSPGDFALVIAPRIAPKSGDTTCIMYVTLLQIFELLKLNFALPYNSCTNSK